MPGKRRQLDRNKKAARKKVDMLHPSGESRYGRKQSYLNSTSATKGGWGFDYPEPKPWK